MASRWYQWEGVIWPEHLDVDFEGHYILDPIIDFGVKGFISPLHSMDGGKPHFHWIMCFDSSKTYEQVMGMLKDEHLDECVNTVKYVKDLTTRVRYLTHEDNPKKFHYAAEDVISIGGMDREQFMHFTSDKVQTDVSLMKVIDTYRVRSFAQLVKYCMYVDKESYRSVVGRCGFWSAYLRSLREDPNSFELQNIIDERISSNA